jgi:L-rhamnose mutarotase
MMQRHMQVIGLRPERKAEYLALHASVWPQVIERLALSNVTNYSIFLFDSLLIAYFEYSGSDYDEDMAAIAADPATRDWWKLTDPCQYPVDGAEQGRGWADAEEVFHMTHHNDDLEVTT